MNKAFFPLVLFASLIFDLILSIRYFPALNFALVFAFGLFYLRSKPLKEVFAWLIVAGLIYDAASFYRVPIYAISISIFMFIISYLAKRSFDLNSNISVYFLTLIFSIVLFVMKIIFDFKSINTFIFISGLLFFISSAIISTLITPIFHKHKL